MPPISYNINPFVNIITWNIANFGNEEFNYKGIITYNHKFNLKRKENVDEYIIRLINIVSSMRNIIDTNKTDRGLNPYLFCQELPQLEHGAPTVDRTNQPLFIELFNKLLAQQGLGMLGNPNYECNLIYDIRAKLELTYVAELSNEPN